MENQELRRCGSSPRTLAYRAAKVLRDVPSLFPQQALRLDAPADRIIAHMADLMSWGVSIAKGGYEWKPAGSDDWNAEVDRFFSGLAEIDAALAADGFRDRWTN